MKFLLPLVLWCLSPLFLVGATVTSVGNGSWMDGTNWSTGSPPTSSDDVIVKHDITLSTASTTDSSLSITNTGSTTAAVEVSSGRTLTVTNDVTMTAENIANIVRLYMNGATLNVGGNLTLTRVAANTKSSAAHINTAGASTINITGSLSINYLNSSGSEGTVELDINQSCAVNVGGSMNVQITGTGNNCTVHLSGAGIGGALHVSGNISVTQSGSDKGEFKLIGASTLTAANMTLTKSGGTNTYYFLVDGTSTATLTGSLTMNHNGTAASTIETEVSTSAVLIVGGNVQLQAVAAGDLLIDLNNSGTLKVGGNITRNSPAYGSLTATTNATVELNGTSAMQTLPESAGAGGDSFTYANITINNTSGLLPAVTLQNNTGGGVTVNGTLALTNGQLDLNGEKIYITTTGSGSVTRTNGSVLAKSSTYSDAIVWTINSNGNLYTFPFSGANGDYIPVLFQRTAGNVGVVSISNYGTDASSNPNNSPAPPGVTVSNTLKLVDRFWNLSLSGSGTVNLTFTYCTDDLSGQNSITESSLKAQRWNGSSWGAPQGTVNTGLNQVAMTGLTSFDNTWTMLDESPLPVELVFFKAEKKESRVALQWQTAQETDNDFFTIEKSTDGIRWETLVVVEGTGTSATATAYQAFDEQPVPGDNYYRLKQTDVDGSFSWSGTVLVFMENPAVSWQVYPNPAHEIIRVDVQGIAGPFTLLLANGNGQVVKTLENNTEGREATLDLSALENGLYFLVLQAGQSRQVKPVVVWH